MATQAQSELEADQYSKQDIWKGLSKGKKNAVIASVFLVLAGIIILIVLAATVGLNNDELFGGNGFFKLANLAPPPVPVVGNLSQANWTVSPISFQRVIVYALISEDSPTFPKSQCDTPNECLKEVVFENEGCCIGGKINLGRPSKCTFSGELCCDISPEASCAKGSPWFGRSPGPVASKFIEFVEGDTNLNLALGAVAQPILWRKALSDKYNQKQATFRTATIQWCKTPSVTNTKFRAVGMSKTHEFVSKTCSSSIVPATPMSFTSRGAVNFMMTYNLTSTVVVYNTTLRRVDFSTSPECVQDNGLWWCLTEPPWTASASR